MDKLRLFHLCVTIVIASQGITYLLGLAEAMKSVSVPTFAETRKAIDVAIAGRLRILYYCALFAGLVVLVSNFDGAQGKVFLTTLIATLLIFADIVIALKGSVPINISYKQYPAANTNWAGLQADWIRLIYYRGVCSTLALVALLVQWLGR